jgi:hypothetical protein
MLPNKDLDPKAPTNTRELREQVDRAKRLVESNPRGVGYTLVNTTITDGAIPEPKVMQISRERGAPLALPFDEKTPPQVNVQTWDLAVRPEGKRPADAMPGECSIQADAASFYGLPD